jgi:ABC-type uncharacterized transport system ATPase component
MDNSLKERLSSLRDGISRVQAYRDFLNGQITSSDADVVRLRHRSDLFQRCSEVYKSWLEDSLRSNIDSMADLATTGLRHIIHDQSLTFRIQQEMKYNRVSIKFLLEEDGTEGNPMDSFGGGAVLVISLILRLAVMARMGMGNLLLLDESMFALANRYVPAAASFMRQLAEETNINILMVTHNEEFMNNAHTAYEAYKDGSLRLKRRSVR